MIRLGVNIDHVATVRQARRGAEPDPVAAADKILAHIESKRDALHINTQKERKMYDMKSRRELQ